MGLTRSLRASCKVRERIIDGQRVITLEPHSRRTKRHILCLHGGAYVLPLLEPHWSIIAELIRNTGATLTVPVYALAPENDHKPATTLVDTVYHELVANRPHVLLFVAGGNFGATLAIRCRDTGKPMPSGLILLSPWLDLALRDERMRSIEPCEVMLGVDGLRLCGRWWAGNADPQSPEFSPLGADLSGLPPIAMFQDDRDIFVIDARIFASACKSADVPCLYREYPGAFHVFMGATFARKVKDVFKRIAAFVDDATEERASGVAESSRRQIEPSEFCTAQRLN